MSKQSKLVRYIAANPPKHKGGTQHIGQKGYQIAEDAIAAAEAAKVAATATGSNQSDGDESSSDSVDSDSSDDAVGDASASVPRAAVECIARVPPPEPQPEQRVATHPTELLDTALANGGWKSVISTLETQFAFHCTPGDTDAGETADRLLAWLQRVGGAAIAGVEASAATDKAKSSVSKAVAKVLYTLYELDLVEVSSILGWADRCAVEQPLVSQAVHPVVTFLSADTEEDESSSTGEDNDDD